MWSLQLLPWKSSKSGGDDFKVKIAILMSQQHLHTLDHASRHKSYHSSISIIIFLLSPKNLLVLFTLIQQRSCKALWAIIREAHENISEEKGEQLIVCTSLVECGHSNLERQVPAVVRVFNLDTEMKKNRMA